jgi:L-threonylcarbamoyladenylate synthase
MRILNATNTSQKDMVSAAVETLQNGGLVVFPTETTYGIGANALDQKAIDKLLQYKQRREGKPLSIAVANLQMAETYVDVNEAAKKVYSTFLPGPVTVVSTGKHIVAKGVESETGSLGIRIPDYPLVTELVKVFGKPITATGANASYKKRPYTVQDILDHLSEKQKKLIDLILDVGELEHNEPSTVIDTTLDDPIVLRQGSIQFTESQSVTTHSAEETQLLGKRLMAKYKNLLTYKTIVFCLQGEMGAGKTQLSKGIAQALGVKETIVSPTYTFSRNYPFEAEGQKKEFVHIDTWRIVSADELADLGFAKMVDDCSVISIEWAEKTKDVLNQYVDEAKIIWIKLEYGEHENDRTITYSDTSK